MPKPRLRDQPTVVKVAVFVSFFSAWVLFEELIIDRYGLWHYLPFYRVGLFCAWDVLALAIIGLGLFLRLERPAASTREPLCRIKWCRRC